MSETQKASLSPEVVLGQLKHNGVTHVLWLPDSETNWLYLLMKAEPSLRLVGVTREGLAFSAAAGVWAGGKTPVILIQNTVIVVIGIAGVADQIVVGVRLRRVEDQRAVVVAARGLAAAARVVQDRAREVAEIGRAHV